MSEHFVIPASVGPQSINVCALLDPGANGPCFVDYDFALLNNFRLRPLPHRISLYNFEDESAKFQNGILTQYVLADLELGSHVEKEAILLIARFPKYPLVLGGTWFRQHEPGCSRLGRGESLLLNSKYCQQHCLPQGNASEEVHLISNLSSSPERLSKGIDTSLHRRECLRLEHQAGGRPASLHLPV